MNAQTIGARIRAKRKEFGLTPLGLASACGWADGNGAERIAAYERGEREPSVAELRAMARIMRCTIADLGARKEAP